MQCNVHGISYNSIYGSILMKIHDQAVTKWGEPQYGIVFPKYKKGNTFIVCKVFKSTDVL